MWGLGESRFTHSVGNPSGVTRSWSLPYAAITERAPRSVADDIDAWTCEDVCEVESDPICRLCGKYLWINGSRLC
jgi:hypothetical protein